MDAPGSSLHQARVEVQRDQRRAIDHEGRSSDRFDGARAAGKSGPCRQQFALHSPRLEERPRARWPLQETAAQNLLVARRGSVADPDPRTTR